MIINIIGGGLAGSECAYQLAKEGLTVNLYEMKPKRFSEAHVSESLAEIVCSNSFKANSVTNACGLLKEELRRLGSIIIKTADEFAIPAGQALAVDRDKFSEKITNILQGMGNVNIIREEVLEIERLITEDSIVVIATGPLTSEELSNDLRKLIGSDYLYFYDAAAPVISADSIDVNKTFRADRYDKGENGGDYINCPMSKGEYDLFYNELINAQTANKHEFEKKLLFEGCMPIEEMAKRGEKTLIFGMLKPVGFENHTEERPYAVVQLRQDNKEGTMYNMVGFQTSLKFGEQDRVFKMIPGLENAEILRYGVMHRNTYINAPTILNDKYMMITNSELYKNKIYFAGQISGVEGYTESTSSGLVVALDILNRMGLGKEYNFSNKTMIGAISNYICSENDKFQPMNANYGILNVLEEKVRDKKERYIQMAKRSLEEIEVLVNGK